MLLLSPARTPFRLVSTLILAALLSFALTYPVKAQPAQTQVPVESFAEAEQLYQQSVKLREAGQYTEAQILAERALAIYKQFLGSEHPEVAKGLNNLGVLHLVRGNYAAAKPLLERSLVIREKTLKPDDPDVASSLHYLGGLSFLQGDYDRAEALYKRSLAIREKALGMEHIDVAKSLNNLANVYLTKGDYIKAETLYKRGLMIAEKVLGVENSYVATLLNNVASLRYEQGDFVEAESLYKRSLAIREKLLGLEHPDVAQSLYGLASIYGEQFDYTQAVPLLRRSSAIYAKAVGAQSPEVARGLGALGALYLYQGDYTQAEPLLRRSSAMYEKAAGAEHPEVARILDFLASLHRDRGEYTAAERLYQRSLSIRQKNLGPQNPLVAANMQDLAILHLGQRRTTVALDLLTQVLDIHEHNLSLGLGTGTEGQKRDYVVSLAESADVAAWMHLAHAPTRATATRLALATVLRRKGRVLDALATDLALSRVRLDAQGQMRLDTLNQTRARLAALAFGNSSTQDPAKSKAEWQRLDLQAKQLERELAETSAQFRAQARPVSLETVQRQVPKRSVLVEIVRYRPFNMGVRRKTDRFGPPRYAAYLLPSAGEAQGLDLGPAVRIDALAGTLVALLRDPHSDPVRMRAASRALHSALWQPLERRFPARTRQVLVAPDGPLNLLPFAALVDTGGHYLLERFELTYLASGRDLLRLGSSAPLPRESALILGGPDFEQAQFVAQSAPGERSAGERPLNLADLVVPPLPGASREADAVAGLLPGSRLLTGAQATENALKSVRGPALLHIATHGFFLPGAVAGGLPRPDSLVQNPLLRSGLALAGFNERNSGTEDGVLTALEAVGLDLEGTGLVVLSACDTGLGDVSNSEGIYGLRRAFTIAGARSQVFSLWKVDDAATSVLVERYYRQLLSGRGRGEALRQVQLALRQSAKYSHPYWWAGFVEAGDWRPLNNLR